MRCGSEYGWVHEYIFSDDNWNRVWEPWVQRLYNPIHASWFSSSLDGKKLTTYVHSHDGRYSICSPRFYVYVYIVKTLHLNQPSSSSNVYQERCWEEDTGQETRFFYSAHASTKRIRDKDSLVSHYCLYMSYSSRRQRHSILHTHETGWRKMFADILQIMANKDLYFSCFLPIIIHICNAGRYKSKTFTHVST